MSSPEHARLAQNAAEILFDEAFSNQANPLDVIADSMTPEEFTVFCKLFSFECQKLMDRQIRIWEQGNF
ncbi:hypothetical protein IQ266_17895 [filamentous cyanobacterium LEGE 11480]|uniref:Uncharacterized protein n=1 Tax=Romeriopsis navalis LEGE 11480 TaxID=2777977 RepID=A0A928Z4C1_9CYAN|nr:hypothetical protein [Romeriopsis navalis]MBE9031609.1 hypothetical protein [Romeriopsis navalis LEGE 11480]